MTRFIGHSAGRSGSLYVTKVMRSAGLEVTHETWFNEWHRPGGIVDWPPHLLGEWSAQAYSYLHRFPDVWLLHQVRHPLKVVGSYLGFGLPQDPRMFGAEGMLIADQYRLWETDDPIRRACLIWLRANQIVWPSERRVQWQVEELNYTLLSQVLARMGVPVDEERLADVFDAVSEKTNTRNNAVEVSWDDVPADLVDGMRGMALGFGYHK